MKMVQQNETHIPAALGRALSYFGGRLSGERRYGWHKKSVGSKIIVDNAAYWLRLQWSPVDEKVNRRNWEGELQAASFVGIRKPTIQAHYDWISDDYLWRATLMTLIDSATCSSTPELRHKLVLPKQWLADLHSSLSALSAYQTDRVTCRQDLITRRIRERFGDAVDGTVNDWTTCHGDIHWANLTCPDLYILDWEGWGIGPKGLDSAFLLGYSLLQPDIAEAVRAKFYTELESESGRKSILFVCAELLRMIEVHEDHPDLGEPLKQLAKQTLSSIARD